MFCPLLLSSLPWLKVARRRRNRRADEWNRREAYPHSRQRLPPRIRNKTTADNRRIRSSSVRESVEDRLRDGVFASRPSLMVIQWLVLLLHMAAGALVKVGLRRLP